MDDATPHAVAVRAPCRRHSFGVRHDGVVIFAGPPCIRQGLPLHPLKSLAISARERWMQQ